jgi:hypothetical protein
MMNIVVQRASQALGAIQQPSETRCCRYTC